MYSVVLMAALATSADVPNCHGHSCGCYGGGYYGGCYGGCYGCWGGCYGCYGGCYGCYGGCYGCYGGCYGCYGCYGGGIIVAPAAPAAPVEKIPAPKPKEEAAAARTAKLVVSLPADANLYIDDTLMKTPSGKRTFNTPAIDRGQAYYYMVRAEVVRDGKTYSETRRVIIRAGDTSDATFTEAQLVKAANDVTKAVASAK